MIAETLLSNLNGVRRSGDDCWVARCPAHNDRTPSLAIREVDDRVLVHCFTGCDVTSVLSAVGLELTDLFPPNGYTGIGRKLRRPFPPATVLRCLTGEIAFLVVCASDMAGGKILAEVDINRLGLAATRFRAALDAGGLGHVR